MEEVEEEISGCLRVIICGLIIAWLNFPPSLGLRKHTHMHAHACVHAIFFLCYTFIFFPLSTCTHPARPSSFMRFPDVDRFRPSVCVPSWLMLLLYNIRLPLWEPRDPLWSWAWPPTSLKVKVGEHGVYCRLQVSGTDLQLVIWMSHSSKWTFYYSLILELFTTLNNQTWAVPSASWEILLLKYKYRHTFF